MDLFDDLPEPVNNNCSVASNYGSNSAETETRGQKRKSEVGNSDEEENSHSRIKGGEQKKSQRIESSIILRGYVAELQGEREDMQDSNVIIDDFTPQIKYLHSDVSRVSFYGVFDGHAGSRASRYAASHLPSNLALKFSKGDPIQIEKDVGKCFTDAFKKTDEDFLKEATKRKPTWKDGTTAIVVLAVNDTLYTANLGDSKVTLSINKRTSEDLSFEAILCRYSEERGKNISVALSKDHSPTQYEERMRIQKFGGHVRDGRVMGILEVSRSIGDGQYKTCGVISIPDVKKCQITESDRFVIMACDGLWKIFTPDEAIEFVCDVFKEKSDNTQYDVACLRLAKEAVRKGSGDNVTVAIVTIDHCNS